MFVRQPVVCVHACVCVHQVCVQRCACVWGMHAALTWTLWLMFAGHRCVCARVCVWGVRAALCVCVRYACSSHLDVVTDVCRSSVCVRARVCVRCTCSTVRVCEVCVQLSPRRCDWCLQVISVCARVCVYNVRAHMLWYSVQYCMTHCGHSAHSTSSTQRWGPRVHSSVENTKEPCRLCEVYQPERNVEHHTYKHSCTRCHSSALQILHIGDGQQVSTDKVIKSRFYITAVDLNTSRIFDVNVKIEPDAQLVGIKNGLDHSLTSSEEPAAVTNAKTAECGILASAGFVSRGAQCNLASRYSNNVQPVGMSLLEGHAGKNVSAFFTSPRLQNCVNTSTSMWMYQVQWRQEPCVAIVTGHNTERLVHTIWSFCGPEISTSENITVVLWSWDTGMWCHRIVSLWIPNEMQNHSTNQQMGCRSPVDWKFSKLLTCHFSEKGVTGEKLPTRVTRCTRTWWWISSFSHTSVRTKPSSPAPPVIAPFTELGLGQADAFLGWNLVRQNEMGSCGVPLFELGAGGVSTGVGVVGLWTHPRPTWAIIVVRRGLQDDANKGTEVCDSVLVLRGLRWGSSNVLRARFPNPQFKFAGWWRFNQSFPLCGKQSVQFETGPSPKKLISRAILSFIKGRLTIYFWSYCCCNTVHVFVSALLVFLLVVKANAECTNQHFCKNEYNSTSLTRSFYRTWWNLTEVPRDIPADAHTVDLSWNIITSLPAGVFRHLSLCYSLRLEGNEISSIDKNAFKEMEALRSLGLEKNRISSIESGTFSGLNSLEKVFLSDNLLSSISPEMFEGLNLRNMRRLWFQRNQIVSVDKDSFREMESLYELDFGNNQISEIETGTFDSVRQLRILNLENNLLSRIKVGTFSGIIFLEDLNLHGNKISTIEERAFDDLYSISEITLGDNQLTTLSPDLFVNMPRPLHLLLSGTSQEPNIFTCQSLCWLRHEWSHGTSIFAIDPICSDMESWRDLQCGSPGNWKKL